MPFFQKDQKFSNISKMVKKILVLMIAIGLAMTVSSLSSEAVVENPTEEIFEEFRNSKENSYILLVHRTPCVDKCLEQVEQIEDHLSRFQMLEPSVEFKIMDVAMLHKVQDYLILDTSHGIYYLFRGERIRVDTNDMTEDNSKYLSADISALLQRRLAVIDSWETIRDLNHTYQHLHLFYEPGESDSISQVEIATKLTNRDIFWVDNPEIAALFKIHHPGMYTFEKSRNDCIRMRDSLESNKIVQFVVTSSKDSPQMFDEDQIHSAIQYEVPLMVVFARSPATKNILNSLLKSTDYLLRSSMQVFELEDADDKRQKAYLDECHIGFNWGFTVCILQSSNGYLYRWVYDKKVLTYDRFHEFVSRFINKTAQPNMKSETLDKTVDGNVHLLNVESFRHLMEPANTNRSKYLVMYYTGTKCEKCKKFKKLYRALASNSDFADLTFAEINISKNEVVEVYHLKRPSLHYTTGYDDPHVQVFPGNFNDAEEVAAWLRKARGDHYEKAKKASEIELEDTDL